MTIWTWRWTLPLLAASLLTPAPAEAAGVDTAKTDAAKTDTGKTDAAKTDTAKTDTAKTDGAKTSNAGTSSAGKSSAGKSSAGKSKAASPAPITPCALKRLPKPAEAKVEGCGPAACVTVTAGARICRCLGDEINGMVLERDGKVQPAFPLSAFMTGVDDFEVLTGDLDGRPGDEWVIANHDTTSNGMGVAFWTIAVADSLERLTTPLTWLVEDYGPGVFAKPRAGAGCDVLATEWTSGSEPKRGPGLYLYGRWYRYTGGQLEPLADRPIVSRRFLEGFARERDGAG